MSAQPGRDEHGRFTRDDRTLAGVCDELAAALDLVIDFMANPAMDGATRIEQAHTAAAHVKRARAGLRMADVGTKPGKERSWSDAGEHD